MPKKDLPAAALTFSIVIPVFHEAGIINEVIGRLCARELGVEAEIIVVDGDSGSDTIGAIAAAGVKKMAAGQGRALQMNRGASIAKGDVLLFLHADTVLPKDALSLVRTAMQNERIVGGAFSLGVDSGNMLFRITEKYVALRTRLTRVPFGDQAIFIRRDYFEMTGGFKEIPLMEDVELMKRVRARKQKICIIPERVRTSPRRFEREGVLYCTFRNLALRTLYAFGMAPERLARWYRSS